jgi:predicted small lipoprotein YifL
MYFCWATKLHLLVIFVLFILSLSSLFSGCGRKGDLVWPDPKTPPASQTTQDSTPTPSPQEPSQP